MAAEVRATPPRQSLNCADMNYPLSLKLLVSRRVLNWHSLLSLFLNPASFGRPKFALQLSLLIPLFALAGCKTHSVSQCTSPQITGRVLDLQTHQPIKNVRVRRITANDSRKPLDSPKGAQLMGQPSAVYTTADGTFVLDSQRSIAVLRKLSWYSVSLVFHHPAYQRCTATYTLTNSTNTPAGEPLVITGDILLTPSPPHLRR